MVVRKPCVDITLAYQSATYRGFNIRTYATPVKGGFVPAATIPRNSRSVDGRPRTAGWSTVSFGTRLLN